MARKKGNKPMTQQVRIYERDARLIRLILATRERGETFADVISEAIAAKFNTSQTDKIVEQIEDVEIENEAFDRSKRNAG